MVRDSLTLQIALPRLGLTIRAADTPEQRSTAKKLIDERYAWRGYRSHFASDEDPDQLTLVASDQKSGAAIATLTVGLDGRRGLLAEGLYRTEVQRLRTAGSSLCEVLKFAVRDGTSSKRWLPTLFHVAFLYAYDLRQRTHLLIEVTPRHARFYQRQLHFRPLGKEKLNPRVNTRGVLLGLDLDHAAEEIDRHGGKRESSAESSLYPYALSPVEASVIRSRLLPGEPTVGIAA